MRKAPKKCPSCNNFLMSLALDSGGISTMWCPECGVVVKWDCIAERVKETITPRLALRAANIEAARKHDTEERYIERKYGPI